MMLCMHTHDMSCTIYLHVQCFTGYEERQKERPAWRSGVSVTASGSSEPASFVGRSTTTCAGALQGAFCRHCANGDGLPRVAYTAATHDKVAHCASCEDDHIVLRFITIYLGVLAALVLARFVLRLAGSRGPKIVPRAH